MIHRELDNQITSERKIYKASALWLGTFFGGPLAAGYIIAENFKAFNRPDNAKKTWLFTIVATIVIFAGIFIIPDDVNIPNQLIPLIYTGIAALILHSFQGKQIQSHIKSGGQVYEWGRVVIIGLIGLAITLLTIIGTLFIIDSINNANLSTNTYGMMQHEISYDINNVSTQEIDNLADAFIKTTFFDNDITKYVYVEKVANSYEISISCNHAIVDEPEALEPFVQLKDDIQLLYPMTKIVLILVVDYFDNVVKRLE